MYNNQHNVYEDVAEGNIEQLIIIYEGLLHLIKKAQKEEKGENLETALKILVKLFASTEDTEESEAKKALQSFYLISIKHIAKIHYCHET